VEEFLNAVLVSLQRLGLAASASPHGLIVKGCFFGCFGRRARITLDGQPFKRGQVAEAVVAVLAALPGKLEAKEKLRNLTDRRKALAALAELKAWEEAARWTYEVDERVQVAATDEGFQVRATTVDEETLEWLLEMLKGVPL
jgi:hypothetical protein